jgi:hypothetical protein
VEPGVEPSSSSSNMTDSLIMLGTVSMLSSLYSAHTVPFPALPTVCCSWLHWARGGGGGGQCFQQQGVTRS